MSAMFFFDLECSDETIRDVEGVEARDLEQAIAEARSIIAEMADEVTEADTGRIWSLLIRNKAGWVVARIQIKPGDQIYQAKP